MLLGKVNNEQLLSEVFVISNWCVESSCSAVFKGWGLGISPGCYERALSARTKRTQCSYQTMHGRTFSGNAAL